MNEAKVEFGKFYALYNLHPFAVTLAVASVFEKHEALLARWNHDRNAPLADFHYSKAWLTDRAEFLARKITRNNVDATGALRDSKVLGTLNYQDRNTERFGSVALLDAGLQKVFSFAGGRYRIKAMFDGFNLLNVATIQGYTSGNASLATSTQVSSVIPPRVFRFGAQFSF